MKKSEGDLEFIVNHRRNVDIEELTDEYRLVHGEIPWAAMFGLRNRIVHDYGNVDLKVVFETLKYDIPELLELIS